MLMKELRAQVFEANLEIVRRGLVLYTFGNASGISRGDGLVVIKPSGIPYESLKPEHLVITDLQGKLVEGDLKPSSDLATHLVLYRSFPNIGGVVHTHSEYATGWAQARSSIPVFGTTHADYFHGPVPVTQSMTAADIASDYEKNTGDVIVRTFQNINPDSVPAVLVANHGPFAGAKTRGRCAYRLWFWKRLRVWLTLPGTLWRMRRSSVASFTTNTSSASTAKRLTTGSQGKINDALGSRG